MAEWVTITTNTDLPEKSAMADHEANNNGEEEIDRISNLPLPLIAHILSFLPTKEAVATSILSSSWRTLWTEVPNLHFSREKMDWHLNSRTRLCDVINRVFILRKSTKVGKFRLSTSVVDDGCDSMNIGTWVSAAVAGEIEELELDLYREMSTPRVQLPRCFFTCRTIVVLKLYGIIDLEDIVYAVHFPSLKILHLLWVHWGVDSDVRILSGCPVLEEFALKVVDKEEHPAIRVCVPSLKRLRLWLVFCRIGKIKMNTPSLEYFDLQSSDVEEYVIGDLKNLVEARLNMIITQDFPIYAFHNLLEALCNVKFLWLRCMQPLMEEDLHKRRPSVFKYLVRLELILPYPDLGFLVEILRKCPKLEVLVILEVYSTYCPEGWEEPIEVPHCLSSHLTKVEFSEYNGSEGELEIAAYIMKNAEVLKTVTVTMCNCIYLSAERKLGILKSLSLLPRASDVCLLEFD